MKTIPTKEFRTEMTRGLMLFSFALLMITEKATAQGYPFDNLPNNITATLTVDTTKKEAFKNQLLGYNIEGFSTKDQKDFVRKFDPVSIRFPHGVWANFYKWQTDGYQSDDFDNGGHTAALATYVKSIKGHIDGIEELNNDRKQENGYGFNMMWTYSMNFDNAASCVARAKKDLSRGLEVKDIELGNEHFWKNQRSNQVPTTDAFLNRAKSVADALHAEFPEVRVSIPLGWRRNQEGYNREIAGDKKYYDAITVHKYMGADPDKPGESDKAYSSLLTARMTLADDVNWIRSKFGAKPIWLTEWGVSAGSEEENNSAACLGMADVFLFMSENQDIYDRANWFSFNRLLNSMVLVTVENKREPVYPLKKRGYLSAYEILHDVLFDGQMFNSTMSTAQITTDKGSMNAVNARIVTKNGKTSVVAVNLSDKPVTFVLKFGDEVYNKSFKHEALIFGELGSVKNIGIDVNPLANVKTGSGTITLPPLSISKISDLDLTTAPNGKPVVAVTSPLNNTVYELGATIDLSASATDANGTIEKVNFKVNDGFLKSLYTSPYAYTFTPTEAGVYKIAARAFDNENNQVETFITVNVVKQEPYNGSPIAIPGTIEAEDFDKGGQGISYNDSDTENKGGEYRLTEGVDIGTGGSGFTVGYTVGGEWLEYSIDVAEDGLYDVEFHVSSKNGGGQLSLSIDNETVLGTTNVPSTTDWNMYEVFTEQVTLQKGESVLRLDIVKTGFNIDKIVAKKANITGDDHSVFGTEISIYPNPNETGLFRLSRSEEWEVYSIQGVFVAQGKGENVDLSSQPKGVYFLKMKSVINKIIIQ